MRVKSLQDKVLLGNMDDVLRLQLYLKLLQNNIKPIESDIDIILEVYKSGGYKNADEQAEFIKNCISKRLRKSDQSLRNTISKYVTKGVLQKPKNCTLFLREDFIPKLECDRLVVNYIVSHAE